VQIVEFKKEHIDLFDFNAVGDQFKGAFFNKDLTAVIAEKGYTWSMVEADSVLAMAGIVPLWHGVGEAWSLMTPEAIIHIKELHDKAKKVLESFFNQGWQRIQTTVRADFGQGKNWLEHLGFEDEGTMEKYGPDGKDYVRWARIKGRRE